MMRFFFLFIAFTLILASCQSEKPEPLPDVSEIMVDFDVIRFEQELKNKSVDHLLEDYPDFSNTFFKRIIPVLRQKDYQATLDTIIQNPQFINLVDTSLQIHQNFNATIKNLEQAFKYMQYHLPEIDAPDIYTFVSGFEYQRFLMADKELNNIIGLGLDMFLGSTFPYASVSPENPAFSNYLTRSFNAEHIPKKVVELLIDDYLPKTEKNQMLDQMIRNGKKLYLMDKILPTVSDTIVMEYTADQWKWAVENELEMWAFFLKEDLFYETNSMKIKKYLHPSPNAPGMPPNAPGRTANYIGWQIVKSYMRRYPDTLLEDLVNATDAQQFLQKSRYKPKK